MKIPKLIGSLIVLLLMIAACNKDEIKPNQETEIEDKAASSFPLTGTWARYFDGAPGDPVYYIEAVRIGPPGAHLYGTFKKQILIVENGKSRLIDNEESMYFARKAAGDYNPPDNATDVTYYMMFHDAQGKEKHKGLTHRSYDDNSMPHMIWSDLYEGAEPIFFNAEVP